MTEWEWCKINLFLDNFFPFLDETETDWHFHKILAWWQFLMFAEKMTSWCWSLIFIQQLAELPMMFVVLQGPKPLMRWTVNCSVPWSLTVVGSRWWMASPDVGDRFMVPNILLVQPFYSLFFPFIVHVILQTIQKHEPAISLPLCNLVISWCMFACMPQVWRVEVPNLSWSKISFYNEGLDGVKRKILSQK